MSSLLPFQRFWLKLCQDRGWSSRRAGAEVGIAGPNAWAYDHGVATPNELQQERIAKIAGVPIEEVARLVWEQKRRRREMLARLREARSELRSEGAGEPEPPSSPWARIEALIGTVEGPEDWAAEHDHYLYGVSKRRRAPRR